MKLFDAHCHLQMRQFDADREAVIARMQEKNMGAIVVGTDYANSEAAVALARQHNFLWASVGLHPNDPSTSSGQVTEKEFDIAKYEILARDPKVVAIGECGLDYFRSGGTDEEREVQKQRFVLQIELALKVNKPLIIHCRNAHDDMLALLSAYSYELANKNVGVVIHFFTGTAELAQQYLELGCYLSFPGPITHTTMYDESIRVTPVDRMLCETDSPFAAPVPYRGARNEPARVEEVVKKMALIKGISAFGLSSQIAMNAELFFSLN